MPLVVLTARPNNNPHANSRRFFETAAVFSVSDRHDQHLTLAQGGLIQFIL